MIFEHILFFLNNDKIFPRMQESDFQLFISELEYWSLLTYKQLEFLKIFGEKPYGMVPNFDVLQSWRLDGLF